MLRRHSILLAILAALTMSACGAEAAGSEGPGAVIPSTGTSSPESSDVPAGAPAITWDEPIPQGLDVSLEELSTLDLPFEPVVKSIPAEFVRAQVSHPGEGPRRLGLLYRLSAGGTTSEDPRVTIYEEVTDVTEAELESASREGLQRELLKLGDTTALLVQYEGVGRIIFVVDGVRYDIAGPALTVADATRISNAIESEASAR